MSVFQNFQKAWGIRFPESELPSAWEDDVRANLEKHRNKLALLREEVEKEEFYVDYLQSLLKDAESQRATYSEDPNSIKSENDFRNSNGDFTPGKNSEESLKTGNNQSSSKQFVTVIEVNSQCIKGGEPDHLNESHNEVLGDMRAKSYSMSSSEGRKKVPPKPPPKVYRRSVSASEPNNSKPGDLKKTMPLNLGNIDETFTSSQGQLDVGLSPSKAHNEINFKLRSYSDKTSEKAKHASKTTSHSFNEASLSKESENTTGTSATKPAYREMARPGDLEPKQQPSASPELDPKEKNQPTPPIHEQMKKLKVDLKDRRLVDSEEDVSSVGSNKDSSQEDRLDSMESRLDSIGSNRSEDRLTSNSDDGVEVKDILMKANEQVDELDEPIYDTVASDNEMDLKEDVGDTMKSGSSAGIGTSASKSEGSYDGETMKSQTSVLSGQSASGTSTSGSGTGTAHSDMDQAQSPVPPEETYVNIKYFLERRRIQGQGSESDEETDGPLFLRTISSDQEEGLDIDSGFSTLQNVEQYIYGDFLKDGVYGSSVESTSALTTTPPRTKAYRKQLSSDDEAARKAEADRVTMYKRIISSIIESETIYLECLEIMLKYMKALKATLETSQPVITEEDFNFVFYKIPELHDIHQKFLEGLKSRTQQWDRRLTIGDHFKILAGKMNEYGSFLKNYKQAVDTVHRCSGENDRFATITKAIKLNSLKGQSLSLEELLHKPVARVQKSSSDISDLLKHTPESHPDHGTLTTALVMVQTFLNEFNIRQAEAMFPAQDTTQRHLVRNSFIVELSEGHRKLRHLFLFNDCLVCAKYKTSGREKLAFEVKWYLVICDIALPDEERGTIDKKPLEGKSLPRPKETAPANLIALKSQACTVRDQIKKQESREDVRGRSRPGGRQLDKQKKKLTELEGQLVLASPNLVFQVGNRNGGKPHTFLLSSDFDRSQWIQAIHALQTTTTMPTVHPTMYELQMYITACRKYLGTNMGNFLTRTRKDPDLLVGDLLVNVHSIQGLTRVADMFIVIELDSYGHYFCKAKTPVCRNTMEPNWNQEFIVDMEGSQTMRLLCYEDHPSQGVILRGKAHMELHSSWLSEGTKEKRVSLQELVLTLSLKFLPATQTLARAPSSKPQGLFGEHIINVCKREKRSVPFIVTSCVREIERRGMHEEGIYRVSGSSLFIIKMKKAFESKIHEADLMLREVDIHSVSGLLKMYLRELPEALFSDQLYPQFFTCFSQGDTPARTKQLLQLFNSLPQINQSCIVYLIEHLVRVNLQEEHNKMSLRNLATVFGPTLLRPGSKKVGAEGKKLSGVDLAMGTMDVLAQAGVLYFFLVRRANGESIQGVE